MRRVARETVFKLVFEFTFLGKTDEDTLDTMLLADDLDNDDKQYISDTYHGIMNDFDVLKEKIASTVSNYTVDRLYRPDLVVLVLALYEINKGDVPEKVIINEAVELAKRYGTDKSGGFVNGVLAKLIA